MATILGYLPRIEQLRLQGLDMWWYTIGFSRVQWCFVLPKIFYFADKSAQIMAVNANGELERFNFKGRLLDFSDSDGWQSCQIGQARQFQSYSKYVGSTIYRILKMEPIQRCFTIEKKGPLNSDGF